MTANPCGTPYTDCMREALIRDVAEGLLQAVLREAEIEVEAFRRA